MKISLIFFFLFIGTNFTNAQYDYLIITPDIFLEGARWDKDLLDLQISRGFHPVIEVVTVFTTSEEIKSIIQSYYDNNPLKYVLLMGNGKNFYENNSNASYIPFFSIESNNPWDSLGYSDVLTDDPYVDDLDSRGPVYLGRLPVTSVEEADNCVDKLAVYYNSLTTYSEARNREILLNLDINRTCCTAELVRYLTDKLKEDHIPGSTSIVELNVSEYDYCSPDWASYIYCPQRKKIFEEALNKGASVISILATSGGPVSFGGWYWASDNRETLPFPEISFNLTNKNTAMPFLIGTNNQQGDVNNPDFECTMRKMMVFKDGGIIGAIAPSHQTVQHANGYVLNRFHDLIYQEEIISYGEIFKVLKKELLSNFSFYEFYVNGLAYFGDPSLIPSIKKLPPGTKGLILPKTYELSYNFPNPFNPTTTIRYNIPITSFINIVVYDILGREITTLVNEEKHPGIFEVEFNASQLSSGIYFYKLQTENFSSTKKMIYLK